VRTTRHPARAKHLACDLVTIVSGDVRDPQTPAPATAGVHVGVSAVHGFTDPHRNSLAAVDRDGNANLIEAAKGAGANVVLMSTVGATADSPMELFRMNTRPNRTPPRAASSPRSCERPHSSNCGST